jgi:aspartyl-tRNA(Asn)/glutamyl-tRNA(Gln) amidotransferase subunit C
MPRVTIETVERVARLARLSLSEDERATFARQLDEILAYAEALQALDTSGVPEPGDTGEPLPLRDDVLHPGLRRERVLEKAPDAADGLFRVPRVIGG